MDRVLNGLIAASMLLLVLKFLRKDGKWTTETVRQAFCFFTVQSNTLCAVSGLLLCVFPGPAGPGR